MDSWMDGSHIERDGWYMQRHQQFPTGVRIGDRSHEYDPVHDDFRYEFVRIKEGLRQEVRDGRVRYVEPVGDYAGPIYTNKMAQFMSDGVVKRPPEEQIERERREYWEKQVKLIEKYYNK